MENTPLILRTFARLSVNQAIVQFNPDIHLEDLQDVMKTTAIAQRLGIKLDKGAGLGKFKSKFSKKPLSID